MNNLPLPEVFIITYQSEVTLHKMLESLEKCKSEFIRVTVVDNGESNEELFKRYEFKLNYIKNKGNLDTWGNIDVAIASATEDFFVVYHDDDLAVPGALTLQRDFLAEHPNVAMVATNVEVFNNNFPVSDENFGITGDYKVFPPKTLFLEFTLKDFYLPLPTIMYRRIPIQNSKIKLREMFVGNLTDIFLWVYMNRFYDLAFINKKLYKYYIKYTNGDIFSYPSKGPYFFQQYQFLYRITQFIDLTGTELRARKKRMIYLAKKNISLIIEKPELWNGFVETILTDKEILKISGTHRFLAKFKKSPKMILGTYSLLKKIKQKIK